MDERRRGRYTGCGMVLSPEQQEKLKRIADGHGVDLVVLFGSMAGGRTHARSDVDLGVRFGKGTPPTWRALGELACELQEAWSLAT